VREGGRRGRVAVVAFLIPRSREEEETTSMTSSFPVVGGFTPGATMARPALSLDAPRATAAVHV